MDDKQIAELTAAIKDLTLEVAALKDTVDTNTRGLGSVLGKLIEAIERAIVYLLK